MHAHAANVYRRVYLESASPAQVLDQLFGALLDDVQRAGARMRAGDVAGKAAEVGHALRIIAELQAALDHRAAPEMCANLARLYEFVSARLTQASATLDPELLAPVGAILASLRDAFRAAARAY
jgi:flagellar secretion chaperone FliS